MSDILKDDKGLGDTIERITKATGIKKAVDALSELTGKDCNCGQRKEKLNKLIPYGSKSNKPRRNVKPYSWMENKDV